MTRQRRISSVEVERVPNRRCQQFLLIRKEEPDLAPQCRYGDCDNVVDADDGVSLESVTYTYGNLSRQTPNCSGDWRDRDSGEVGPHKFPGQDQNGPSLIKLGDVNRSQSISSSKPAA